MGSSSTTKRLQDDLHDLGLNIKQHADNVKSLVARKNMLEDSVIKKMVILGEDHSSATPSIEALIAASSKDVIGIVATLAKIDNENLSRLVSEYLGVETMLTFVCKTQEGIEALERCYREGSTDKSAGLHGLGSSTGRTSNGRFHIICLEYLMPYVGDFVTDDPQRRLDLIKPKLPNGECPPGFLGFAVNMVNIDTIHLFCLTAGGHGLRETLFYRLFSKTHVYNTRVDMFRALPCIDAGAISLDGGIIRAPGEYRLGNRDEVDVIFPVPFSASRALAIYHERQDQIRDLKMQREKLMEDLQLERLMMNKAIADVERKEQELRTVQAQSSSNAMLGSSPATLKFFRRRKEL